MKRVIIATKTFEYNTYTIYDTGNGFKVYKDGQQVSDTEFVNDSEAKEFIDGLVDACSHIR